MKTGVVSGPGFRVTVSRFPDIRVAYALPRAANVRLDICAMDGRTIGVLVNQGQGKGDHEVKWNAAELVSGMYVCRLVTDGTVFSETCIVR